MVLIWFSVCITVEAIQAIQDISTLITVVNLCDTLMHATALLSSLCSKLANDHRSKSTRLCLDLPEWLICGRDALWSKFEFWNMVQLKSFDASLGFASGASYASRGCTGDGARRCARYTGPLRQTGRMRAYGATRYGNPGSAQSAIPIRSCIWVSNCTDSQRYCPAFPVGLLRTEDCSMWAVDK